jgi:hypothetical protein
MSWNPDANTYGDWGPDDPGKKKDTPAVREGRDPKEPGRDTRTLDPRNDD